MQARAAQDQANAQLKLAQTTALRYQTLEQADAVSKQETDERTSASTQGQANLASASANVKRLGQLEGFKHIYAPFSGVITKRNVDIGALINAGNSGSNGELFDMAQLDPIRVYVDVPEIYAPSIRVGVPATIELSSLAGEHFKGNVARTADSIDLATRTMRTEIDVPNPKGVLLPGAYAQVHFDVNITTPRLTIPVNALLFRAEGTRAAVVGGDGKVHLKPVVIGRDYGTTLEILGGLDEKDSIILNPSDSLEEGQQVQVQTQGGNEGGTSAKKLREESPHEMEVFRVHLSHYFFRLRFVDCFCLWGRTKIQKARCDHARKLAGSCPVATGQSNGLDP